MTKPVCGGVEAYPYQPSLCVNVSIVAKGYRFRFTSPPLLLKVPWEIRSPKGPQKIQGMQEQIYLTLQTNAINEIPPDTPGFYSNVFLTFTCTL